VAFDVRWRISGGITAATGFVFIGLAVALEFATLTEAGHYLGFVQTTWVPGPALYPTLSFVALGVAAGLGGGGLLLLGLSRPERDREEDLRLDPLLFAPVRSRWKRYLPGAIVAVVVLVLPGLWVVPVAHPFSAVVPVGDCSGPTPVTEVHVSIPTGAVLAYQWSSTDGSVVGEVWAPSGPPVGSALQVGDLFLNSSWGYSAVDGNGTPITLWACDFGTPSGGTPSVRFTGTYYLSLL